MGQTGEGLGSKVQGRVKALCGRGQPLSDLMYGGKFSAVIGLKKTIA